MNFLIFFYLFLIAPKIFWERIKKGKRHPGFFQRIGLRIPHKGSRDLIWIHAVSVGEVKAAVPIFLALKEKYPIHFFLITTTSATGQEEAKRSLNKADSFAFLPIDLSFVVKRWIKKLDPKMFILVESDFWLNLLKALKKNRTKIILVSGKMSLRSFKRLQWVPFFGKKLFSYFDLLCVQNAIHYERFAPFAVNKDSLLISGNLKLDQEPKTITSYHYDFKKPLVVISCTHSPEEEMILEALGEGHWHIALAPRHPERFEIVKRLLEKKKISFSTLSSGKLQGDLLLIDQMGKLPYFYSICTLAIVGGSFIDHIGGHNVLEPSLYGAPVIFGPHMFGQIEFANLAIESGAGRSIECHNLKEFVTEFLSSPPLQIEMKRAALTLIEQSRGAAKKTVEKITCG